MHGLCQNTVFCCEFKNLDNLFTFLFFFVGFGIFDYFRDVIFEDLSATRGYPKLSYMRIFSCLGKNFSEQPKDNYFSWLWSKLCPVIVLRLSGFVVNAELSIMKYKPSVCVPFSWIRGLEGGLGRVLKKVRRSFWRQEVSEEGPFCMSRSILLKKLGNFSGLCSLNLVQEVKFAPQVTNFEA